LSSLLPYQQVVVLHQAFVSLSVCIAQLGPVLFPNVAQNDKEVLKAVSEVIQRIAGVGGAAEHEGKCLAYTFISQPDQVLFQVNRIIQSELRTLRGVRPILPSPAPSFTQASAEDDAIIDTLTAEMESLLIDARLRAHPVIGAMWERVDDEARDRVAGAVSPIDQRFTTTLPQQTLSSFRVDKGIFTSPPASPAKMPSWNANVPARTYHSRATSPMTPTSPTLSFASHAGHRLPDTESIGVSESEQSETGSAATLLELDRRSRSASPFTHVGPVRQGTVSHIAGSHDEAGTDLGGQEVDNGGFLTIVEGRNQPSSVLNLGPTPRSLGKFSGNKTSQQLTPSDGSPVASGAKFFTSAFSKMADL
jgi:hypothetical protein